VQLDEIHGRHRQSGTVDHAGDVAIEGDIVQIVLTRPPLHRVLLAGIAQRRQLRVAEQGARVDVDLGIERDQRAGLGDDQRVDLDQTQILLHVEAIERLHQGLELGELRSGKSEPEADLARLEALQAGGRVDGDGEDLFRGAVRDFLDVHAAGGGGDERHAALFPVEGK
jgi:hypothetical protein